jgi:hypothetical protein
MYQRGTYINSGYRNHVLIRCFTGECVRAFGVRLSDCMDLVLAAAIFLSDTTKIPKWARSLWRTPGVQALTKSLRPIV